MLVAEIDLSRVVAGAKTLARETGRSVQELVGDQMRLAMQDCIKYTPPRSDKGGNAESKRIGEQAVMGDLNKLFHPIQKEGQLYQWQQQLDEAGFDILNLTNNGDFKIKSQKLVKSASMFHIRDIHLKHRNKRGRVKFKSDKSQAFGGKYLVPKSIMAKYIKKELKKVGQLKAGFVPAGQMFATIFPFRAPGYVKKQADKMGSGGGRINNSGNGSIYGRNTVPYIEIQLRKDMLAFIAKKREKDMKGFAKKRLDKLIKKFNKAA